MPFSSSEANIARAIRRIALAQHGSDRKRGRALDLTPVQIAFLRAIAEAAADGATPGDLARRFQIRAPTATATIAALAAKGLIAAAPDAKDRRIKRLRPTAAGRETLGRLEDEDDPLVEALSLLGEAAQDRLLVALVRVMRALQLQQALDDARVCATCAAFHPRHGRGERRHFCGVHARALGDRDLQTDCPAHRPAAEAAIRTALAGLGTGD